jgi:hypothetical protein
MLSNNLWKQLLVDIPSREICLEPALRILVLVVIGQALRLLYLVVLIVSNPDDD